MMIMISMAIPMTIMRIMCEMTNYESIFNLDFSQFFWVSTELDSKIFIVV